MTRLDQIRDQFMRQSCAAMYHAGACIGRDPMIARERSRVAVEQKDEPGMEAALRVAAVWWGGDATASYVRGDPLPCQLGHAIFQGTFVVAGKGKTWLEAVEAARPLDVAR